MKTLKIKGSALPALLLSACMLLPSAAPLAARVRAEATAGGTGMVASEAPAESGSASEETKSRFEENILISAFWLPTYEYMGEDLKRWDEQYSLMSEAGIDWLCHVTDNVHGAANKLTSKEMNVRMAEYAAKYGMQLSVADSRFGKNLLTMTDEDIEALVAEYRDLPGVGGYYIWDEPAPGENLADYNRVYAAMKRADPDAYMHLNFLPLWAYGGGTVTDAAINSYRQHVGQWLALNAQSGYPQDYVMYDFYPYSGMGTDMRRDVFFDNLDVMRQLGLQYGVKTANYLQATGGNGNRAPSVAEIRYEAMTSLAFGYKQLSYFTWFLPTNRGGENFYDAPVSDKGVPDARYDGIKQLNSEIHALGKTLINLDALQVYINGESRIMRQPVIPQDFFARPNDSARYVLSLLRDRETGRNYLMVVNSDYGAAQTISLHLADEVTALGRISAADGTVTETPVEGNTLEITLEAGDGALYALPEGLDYAAPEGDGPVLDTDAAYEVLAQVEAARSSLAGADTKALDNAVANLRAALNTNAEQSYLDMLTQRVREALAAALAQAPSGGDEGEGGKEETSGGGCGGCGSSAVGGVGTAAAMLTLALGAVLVFRKKHE